MLLLVLSTVIGCEKQNKQLPLKQFFDAIGIGDIDRVKTLSTKTPKLVNFITDTGTTPLHVAAGMGEVEIVKYLILEGARVEAKDKHLVTPLHMAATNSKCNGTIQLLLDSGADINAVDQWHRTPLELAITQITPSATILHMTNFNGDVLLPVGQKEQQVNTVGALLSNGANPNTIMSITKNPIIIYAVSTGEEGLVEVVLNHGADVNMEAKDGLTSLHLAAIQGHEAIALLLIKGGANLDTKTDKGATPIWMAKYNKHQNIVELLRKYGAVE